MKHKKLFAVLTLVCFMFTLVPMTAMATTDSGSTTTPVTPEEIVPDYSWYGDGSATEFSINSVEQLAGLAKLTQNNVTVNGKTLTKTDFAGKTVKLTADITFADNQYWYYNDGTTKYDYCIGTFAGVFDGAVVGSTAVPVETRTITGLKAYKTKRENATIALFKEITADGGVQNLTMKNVAVDISHKYKTTNNVASIAYTLKGDATNCHVDGVYYTVAGYLYGSGSMFGGVSGVAEITNSTAKNVYITIKDAFMNENSTEPDNGHNVGGFAGYIDGNSDKEKVIISGCSIENVYFDCTYKLKYFGGFVGSTAETTMKDCTAINVNFEVDDYIYYIGGFVGRVTANSAFNNCDINANGDGKGVTMDLTRVINKATRVGGFVGTVEGSPATFTYCDVAGIDITMHIKANSPIAGFAGDIRATSEIDNCTASGKIDATDTSEDSAAIAGFIGSTNAATTIKNSTANVEIKANGNAGGFAGDAKNLTVENCHAYGNVTSENGSAGGFAGVSTSNSTLTDCTASGNVTSTNGAAGGLVGYVQPGADVNFGGSCKPADKVEGPIKNEVANDPEKDYTYDDSNDTIKSTNYLCRGKLGNYEFGYDSIQAAVDAGVTEVTLLKVANEDFEVSKNLILNLGVYTLSSEITIPTITDDNPDVHLTITGTSTDNNIILPNATRDHYTFVWCKGIDDVQEQATKVDGNWIAEPGYTYHIHWTHSDYTHLDDATLHPAFEMTYGSTPSTKYIEFKPKLEDVDAKITAIEQGDYFTTSFEGLVAKITPKSGLEVGNYSESILVTVHDGSTHTITATLEVTKADSVVTPKPSVDENRYAYGDTITLTAEVTTAQAVTFALMMDEPTATTDTVVFYKFIDDEYEYLGEEEVSYDNNIAKDSGTATLSCNTMDYGFKIGENIIVAVYGGSVNLNGSQSDSITIILKARELAEGETFTVGEITITGIATIDPENVTVEGGGKIGDIDVPAGVTITVPTDQLANITQGADNEIVVPKDTTVTINGTIITGPASVDADGNVTVEEGGKIGDIDVPADTTITVPADKLTEVTTDIDGNIVLPEGATVVTGSGNTVVVPDDNDAATNNTVLVNPEDGSVTIPAGSKAEVTLQDGTTIVVKGPASVDAKGDVTIDAGGSAVVDGAIVTGSAIIDTNEKGELEVTIEGDGTITTEDGTVVKAPENGSITIPVDRLSEVTTDSKGNIVLPGGSVVTKGDTVTKLPYGGSIDENGTVTVNPAPSTGGGFSGVYNYQVAVVQPSNGTITLSESNAVKGETVIVTATPNNGYGTSAVIVTDGDGDTIAVTDLQNGTYSFVMPEGKVSVTAVFKDAIVLKIGDNNMNVFGKTVANDVAPQIKDDYTMLPIRPVVEALDGDVAWDADTQKITVKLNGNTVVMYVGEKVGYINGVATQMDVASYIDNSRALYQLRFVAEATGTDIHWNKATYEVTLIPE